MLRFTHNSLQSVFNNNNFSKLPWELYKLKVNSWLWPCSQISLETRPGKLAILAVIKGASERHKSLILKKETPWDLTWLRRSWDMVWHTHILIGIFLKETLMDFSIMEHLFRVFQWQGHVPKAQGKWTQEKRCAVEKHVRCRREWESQSRMWKWS